MHLINNIHFALLNNYSLSQVPVSITFVCIFREISLGTALFDVFTFIWWPNTCVIHLFYLPYGGTKKKNYEFFCC